MKGLEAVVLLLPEKIETSRLENLAKLLDWYSIQAKLQDTLLGGGVDVTLQVAILTPFMDEEMHNQIWTDPELKNQHVQERFVSIAETLKSSLQTTDTLIQPLDQKSEVQWFAPPHKAKIVSHAQVNHDTWIPVFDPANPLPKLSTPHQAMPTLSQIIENISLYLLTHVLFC